MLTPCAPLPHAPESVLLARWRSGDSTAALCLLRRQVPPLRRYFSRRVVCAADVEDLVQRTLLASIESLPRFREEVELSAFVQAIASKLFLRYRRDVIYTRGRVDPETRVDSVQGREPSALSWVCHEDEAQRLRDAFRELPEDSAHLLHLRYWEEHDTIEIARRLDLNPGTVRMRLHRARHEMKRVLAAMIGTDEPEATGVGARLRPGATSSQKTKKNR